MLEAACGGKKRPSVQLQTLSTGQCRENSWKLKKEKEHHESPFLGCFWRSSTFFYEFRISSYSATVFFLI